jgi:flagellar motor switch protein FliN/FliY
MGNGMLSQEEIDALLRGTLTPEPPIQEPVVEFSDMEKDAIGEIANISMGTAATTLSQLLGKKVDITTPKVDVTNAEQVRKDYPIPSVIVDVKYKAGIEGSNFLILSQRDGSVIVDLMMGGDGRNPSPELSELQISGISEAMNQMMGSAATSMSTMFNSMVDITPPQLMLNDLGAGDHDFFQPEEPLIRISFRMVVEDVIDSILIQVIPISVAKSMVSKLMGTMTAPASQPAAPARPYRP